MLVAAALLLALQAAPAAGASPDRAMLDAFKAACSRVDNLDHMTADARAAGWAPIADDGDPRIGRVNRAGREAVEDDVEMSGQTFRRRLGDRDLFLVASRVVMEDGVWGNGCRVYHFEGAARIDPATLEAWMDRPPTGVQDIPGTAIKLWWEPGWRDGVTVEVNHVPHDSALLRERFGLSGNVLVAQAIGGF